MWALIEQGRILIQCENTTFIYHNDFSKDMNVEGATSENVFDYLFDIGAKKILSGKGKKYLHDLFEKWNPEFLQLNEDFDDNLDNDGLKDSIGDKSM